MPIGCPVPEMDFHDPSILFEPGERPNLYKQICQYVSESRDENRTTSTQYTKADGGVQSSA